jgi:hypothetical protein
VPVLERAPGPHRHGRVQFDVGVEKEQIERFANHCDESSEETLFANMYHFLPRGMNQTGLNLVS